MAYEQVAMTTNLVVLLLPLLVGAASIPPESPNNAELVWMGRKARATQYHTQDAVNGAYQYGYTGPHHSKSESSFNGVTRGGYSYIDANGLMQTVSYTADAEKGFQVHASNMPGRDTLSPVEDTPEVALAKRRHLDQLHRVESWQNQQQPWLQRQYHHQQQQQQPEQDNYNHEAEQPVSRSQKSRSPFLLSSEEARSIPPAPRPSNAIVVESAAAGGASGPSNADGEFPRRFTATSASAHHHYQLIPTAAALPLVMPLPLIHSSMRHSQDSLGQYEYSYTGDTSAKTESRSLDGTTRGAYSYIDANGLLQQVHYIADRDGFRVLATNLPEA